MKKNVLLLAFLISCSGLSAQSGEIHVEGVVRSVVEDIPLPFCEVQVQEVGVTVAGTRSNFDGRYVLPKLKPGEYSLIVTQFGDTLQYVKKLRLIRDTRITSRVSLPVATRGAPSLPTDLKQINLHEVRIYLPPQNKLAKMGLLITNPRDSKLWNFCGRMSSSGPVCEDLSWGNAYGRNPFLARRNLVCPGLTPSSKNSIMKNELLLYGRILDTQIPADTTGNKKD